MDNIDLNLFKIFYVVAKYRSFTKASEQLYVSQPAITKSIKKLEDQLNAELFRRTTNGITLTEVGEAVYYYAEQLCNMIDANSNLVKNIKDSTTGKINIGIPTHIGSFYFVKFLKTFNEKYPFIKVNIINKKSEEMIKMLERRELDIVIDTDMEKIEDPTIVSQKILELHGCFVGNKEFKSLSLKKPLPPEDINNYPLVLPGTSTANRRMLDYYFSKKHITLSPLIEANSSSISRGIIGEGIGIGWMIKEFIQNDINNKELYEIKVDIENVIVPLSIAYHKKYTNKHIIEFSKMIISGISEER